MGDHSTLTSALSLLGRDFSVIPVRPDGTKRPAVRWERYQEEVANEKQVREWFGDGGLWVGIVTGRISGICVVDIDTEAGEEALLHLFGKEFFDVPMVKSQSGGKHLYFAHPGKGDVRNKTRNIEGCDFRGDGGYVVCPPSPGYEWIQSLDEYNLPPLPQEYIETALNPTTQVKKKNGKIQATPMFADGRRDEDLYSVALKLLRGGMSEHEVQIVLNQLAISWGENTSDSAIQKWLQTKIESARKYDARKEGTLAGEVRVWVEEQEGWWTSRECYNELDLTDKSRKEAARKEIARLVKSGDVERSKTKSGTYRRIERVAEIIDYMQEAPKHLDLALPLGLHELIHLHPGNIAVLAGEPNAGKTAWLLNFIRLNMHRFGIDYYSSEMGQSELRMRLDKFEGITPNQWQFRAYERSENFADVVDPNRITVIDFLEMLDNFYLVGQHIHSIHKKLDNGLAIIALQKKRGTDMGRGAEFGLEKPRLYMAMGTREDKNKRLIHYLKIVKAKNWAQDGVNPNNREFYFKLAQGCRFMGVESTAVSEIEF